MSKKKFKKKSLKKRRKKSEKSKEEPVDLNQNDIFYALIDFETTGFGATVNRICQIGLVVLDFEGKKVREWSPNVNPECPIQKQAEKVHHLSNEEFKKSPNFSEEGKKFKKILEFYPKLILVSHNATSLDLPFLFKN